MKKKKSGGGGNIYLQHMDKIAVKSPKKFLISLTLPFWIMLRNWPLIKI
jgi:hypothetical protein